MQGGHGGAGCSLELVGLQAGVAGWLQAGVAGWGCRLVPRAARGSRPGWYSPWACLLWPCLLCGSTGLGLEYVVGFRVVESEDPK